MTTLSLDEYRKCGGYVAVVPDNTSHIVTRSKSLTKRYPPEPGWKEGRVVTETGPETIPVEMTSDGFRVVRLRSAADFFDICRGNNGLQWEQANSALRNQIANESRNSAGPIR